MKSYREINQTRFILQERYKARQITKKAFEERLKAIANAEKILAETL